MQQGRSEKRRMGETTPALRLELRTKNNRLWTAINERWGHGSYRGMRACAEALGLTPSQIGSLVNLQQSPYLKTSDGKVVLRKGAQVLCDALHMFAEDLFPRSLYSGVMPKRVLVATVAPEQFAALSSHDTRHLITDGAETLDQSVLGTELKLAIAESLHSLTPGEERVIRARFGMDGPEQTLKEISIKKNLTTERIRQIEKKALRKLRHPSRSKALKGFISHY